MGGQLITVLLLVMLYLMIWKPGALTDAARAGPAPLGVGLVERAGLGRGGRRSG